MNHSQRVLSTLDLADDVRLTAHCGDVCSRGHVGCWTVSCIVTGEPWGQPVIARQGPYEHLSLTQALDVIATIAAYLSSQLELSAQLAASPQLAMDFEVS